MKTMKNIFWMVIACAFIVAALAVNPPTNLPSNTAGNKAVLANADGSVNISGNASQPSQVGLLSTNGNNYAFITGPTNALVSYNIFLPSSPTNGVFVITSVSNGTNLIGTFVQGVS